VNIGIAAVATGEDTVSSTERIFDPDPPPRIIVERLLRSGDVDTICDTLALLALPYADVHTGGDWAWLGQECLSLLRDHRPSVRATAAQCLAQLVRSHPGLQKGPVPDALRQLLSDADQDVAYEARRMLEVMLWPHPVTLLSSMLPSA
jgi:hypothetical protein